jgi:ribosome biogenesis GTPase A
MRLLQEELKLVDLAVELLDARIPASSRNPHFSRLIGSKQHLVLLHKADRGERRVTTRWLFHFQKTGLHALPFSVFMPQSLGLFFNYLTQQELLLRPARLKRPLRLIITGIPNVGKSTLINYLVKKAAARTGDRPGITRGRQWIRLLPGFELLDTPGILWPNLSEQTALPLAAVGALPAGRVEPQRLAAWLLALIVQRGKEDRLRRRYPGLQPGEPEAMLEQIGLGRGLLMQEGKVNLERSASLLLRDFQNGALGRLSLEEPP